MKSTKLPIFLLFFCYYCSFNIFSMERKQKFILSDNLQYDLREQEKDIPDNIYNESLITEFDKMINEKVSENNLFGLANILLSEEDMIAILKILASERYKIIFQNIKLREKLTEKNNFFSKIISYFLTLAKTNIETVTPHTLDTVTDSSKIQSIPALNQLPPLIKEYFMTSALTSEQHSYEIAIPIKKDRPSHYDFNQDTLALSTGSLLQLWCLKSVKLITELTETSFICALAFNHDRSMLAIATQNNDIKILCAKTLNTISSTRSSKSIYSIKYINNDDFLALCANSTIITLWSYANKCLHMRGQATHLMSALGNPKHNLRPSKIQKSVKVGNYQVPQFLSESSENLFIKKINAIDPSLCEKALKNASQVAACTQIIQSKRFDRLTEYEQGKITHMIAQKK